MGDMNEGKRWAILEATSTRRRHPEPVRFIALSIPRIRQVVHPQTRGARSQPLAAGCLGQACGGAG